VPEPITQQRQRGRRLLARTTQLSGNHRRTRLRGRRWLGCACLVPVMAVGCGTENAPAQPTALTPISGAHIEQFNLTSGGFQRTYFLQIPNAAGERPLVIVLHGADSSPQGAYSTSNFAQIGLSRGWLVAYPAGYEGTWNEGAGGTPARRAGVNDVAFVQAMIEQIEARYAVNRAEIVASGISNGALMVELLGCRLAGTIDLIVPVEGELPATVSPTCHPAKPISVLEVHGTADETIPYGGGHFDGVGGGTTVLSAPASVARWAKLNSCATRPSVMNVPGRKLTTYAACRDDVLTRLLTVIGGAHVFPPDIGQLVTAVLGQTSRRASPKST
jgi:polyhydroxybutyrate depolymerase